MPLHQLLADIERTEREEALKEDQEPKSPPAANGKHVVGAGESNHELHNTSKVRVALAKRWRAQSQGKE